MPRRSPDRLLAAVLSGLLLLLVIGGCASKAGHAPPTNRAVQPAADAASSTTASTPAGRYDRPARSLAAAVAGCTATPASASSAARAGLPGAATLFATAGAAASCSLRGRTAILLTFPNQAAQTRAVAALSPRITYYATGTGWLAIPTDLSDPLGEQSLVQDFALALGGLIQHR